MDYHIHPSFTERPAPYMALALAGDHPGAAATTPAARAAGGVLDAAHTRVLDHGDYVLALQQIVHSDGTNHPAGSFRVAGLLLQDSGSQTHGHEQSSRQPSAACRFPDATVPPSKGHSLRD